jgi:hypothetical protein
LLNATSGGLSVQIPKTMSSTRVLAQSNARPDFRTRQAQCDHVRQTRPEVLGDAGQLPVPQARGERPKKTVRHDHREHRAAQIHRDTHDDEVSSNHQVPTRIRRGRTLKDRVERGAHLRSHCQRERSSDNGTTQVEDGRCDMSER